MDLIYNLADQFQSEIDEHKIQDRLIKAQQKGKTKQLQEYQQQLEINTKLQQLKTATLPLLPDQCKTVQVATQIWDDELHKYGIFLLLNPFTGWAALKKNRQLIDDLHGFTKKYCN